MLDEKTMVSDALAGVNGELVNASSMRSKSYSWANPETIEGGTWPDANTSPVPSLSHSSRTPYSLHIARMD